MWHLRSDLATPPTSIPRSKFRSINIHWLFHPSRWISTGIILLGFVIIKSNTKQEKKVTNCETRGPSATILGLFTNALQFHTNHGAIFHRLSKFQLYILGSQLSQERNSYVAKGCATWKSTVSEESHTESRSMIIWPNLSHQAPTKQRNIDVEGTQVAGTGNETVLSVRLSLTYSLCGSLRLLCELPSGTTFGPITISFLWKFYCYFMLLLLQKNVFQNVSPAYSVSTKLTSKCNWWQW